MDRHELRGPQRLWGGSWRLVVRSRPDVRRQPKRERSQPWRGYERGLRIPGRVRWQPRPHRWDGAHRRAMDPHGAFPDSFRDACRNAFSNAYQFGEGVGCYGTRCTCRPCFARADMQPTPLCRKQRELGLCIVGRDPSCLVELREQLRRSADGHDQHCARFRALGPRVRHRQRRHQQVFRVQRGGPMHEYSDDSNHDA